MVMAKMSKFFKEQPFSSNVLFSMILTALEKIIESNFICPCKNGYTRAILFFYLATPMVVIFVFRVSLLYCNEGSRKQSTNDNNYRQCLSCLILPLVWVALFLMDGRYVACLNTTSKVDYADSSKQLNWKWCDKNQTLTKDQRDAWYSFYNSQISGFVLIIVIFVVVTACCKQKSDQSKEEDNLIIPENMAQPLQYRLKNLTVRELLEMSPEGNEATV